MAEVTVDEDLVYAPEKLVCPTCLSIFIGGRPWEGSPCPDDKTPQVRLTWKLYAEHFRKRAEYLEKRNDEMVKVNHQLRESVNNMAREAGYIPD